MSDVEEQLNRAAKQLREVAARQEFAAASLDDLRNHDNRRMALEWASKLMMHSAAMTGIVNSASILGVADMYYKWLQDGALPDLAAEAKQTAAYAWNLLKGGFPADVINKAMEDSKK